MPNLELLAPNKYESDLSNEVLCILVAQRTLELLKIKVADLEKIVLQIKVDSKEWAPGSVTPNFFSDLQI